MNLLLKKMKMVPTCNRFSYACVFKSFFYSVKHAKQITKIVFFFNYANSKFMLILLGVKVRPYNYS